MASLMRMVGLRPAAASATPVTMNAASALSEPDERPKTPPPPPKGSGRWHRTGPKNPNELDPSIIPTGPMSVLRDHVRRCVFRIDRFSATAIATLIFEDCTQAQSIAFIEGFFVACKECRGRLRDRCDWNETELFKQISPAFAQLWDIVNEYKGKHARRLSAHNLRDVHVEYEYGTYQPAKLQAEWAYIMRQGGKVYHQWPRYEQFPQLSCPSRMGVDIILKPETLEELYPDSREDVEVNVNIEPIDPNTPNPHVIEISPRLQAGKLFPYYLPSSSSAGPLHRLPAERQEEIRQEVDQVCSGRPRGDSIQALLDATKGSRTWYAGKSKNPTTRFQPEWSPDSQPFTRDVPGASNHEWWQKEWAEHQQKMQAVTQEMAIARGMTVPEPYPLEVLPDPALPLGGGVSEKDRLAASRAELAEKLERVTAIKKDIEFTTSRNRHRNGIDECEERLKALNSDLDQLDEVVNDLKVEIFNLQDRSDHGVLSTSVPTPNEDGEAVRSDSAVWLRSSARQVRTSASSAAPTPAGQNSKTWKKSPLPPGLLTLMLNPPPSAVQASNRIALRGSSRFMNITQRTLVPSMRLPHGFVPPPPPPLHHEGGMADTPRPTSGFSPRYVLGRPAGKAHVAYAHLPETERRFGACQQPDAEVDQGEWTDASSPESRHVHFDLPSAAVSSGTDSEPSFPFATAMDGSGSASMEVSSGSTAETAFEPVTPSKWLRNLDVTAAPTPKRRILVMDHYSLDITRSATHLEEIRSRSTRINKRAEYPAGTIPIGSPSSFPRAPTDADIEKQHFHRKYNARETRIMRFRDDPHELALREEEVKRILLNDYGPITGKADFYHRCRETRAEVEKQMARAAQAGGQAAAGGGHGGRRGQQQAANCGCGQQAAVGMHRGREEEAMEA
ncbi:uncharacterized protein LTR77_001184 [Saxophila tyrrhenica]|uniref:Uncharacterized protein n=1 Tax=Saxophila tyrrhenica TaxID=1690608 RepID=A0AAV9PKQ9_9PEZI|nr:hypothetical protein LTR77_001184 [Saxophila tyrrhenica]